MRIQGQAGGTFTNANTLDDDLLSFEYHTFAFVAVLWWNVKFLLKHCETPFELGSQY
jgi:hypothetical protein